MTRTGRSVRLVSCAALAAAALLTTGTPALAVPDATGTATGGELTARWWQVALASGDLSFFEDSTTGDNCQVVELPRGPVVLVAGTLGGTSGARACEIPAGATVVLPVLNTFFTPTEPGETIGVGRRTTREFLQGATATATIDGEPAEVRRIRSSRFLLDVSAFGVDATLPTVSDGLWLVFTAEPGVHEVTTSGCAADGFCSATSYTFTVV